MNQITYINKVGVAEAKNLSTARHGKWVWNEGATSFTEIPIAGLATLSIESSVDNKSLIYTSTLSFTVDAEVLPSLDKVAFQLKAVDGKRLLMGDENRPWVRCTETQTFPDSADSPVKTTVKAVWTSPRKPAELK